MRVEETGRRIDEAIVFLHRELADGSRSSTDVQAAATSAGISLRTLRRAREALGLQPQKSSAGHWIWSLPKVGQDVHVLESGQHEKKRQDFKNKPTLGSIVKSGLNAQQPTFNLNQCLDLIQTASMKRQARDKIKAAFEAAIPEAAEWKKITPEAARNWLMGRTCQYFETVRATWPQGHWRYAKRPADFFAQKLWRENPVIWDRSQHPPKEKERGNSSNIEELRRLIAAARVKEGEPDGVLAAVGPGDEPNPERRAVSSLFPNRNQLAPNGHRSGVRQSGALAQIFSEPLGLDRSNR